VAGAIALVTILTVALSLHGSVRTGDAIATVTTPEPPKDFGTPEGWSEFATGFFIGGCGGAVLRLPIGSNARFAVAVAYSSDIIQ
jgi:photosystem I subunit 11